jgi:chaperonin GroEL (HSP60 family)
MSKRCSKRAALQNAASIAALMLTTEALVSEIPEENGRVLIDLACDQSRREFQM